MKKLFCLLFLLPVLVSCSDGLKGDPFSPFLLSSKADVTLTLNGNSSKFTFTPIADEICFNEPEELLGYKMFQKDGKIYISYSDLSVLVSESAGIILLLTEDVFSSVFEDVLNVKAEDSGGQSITVVETENYLYKFSSDGMPISVTGVFDGQAFEMTFSEFLTEQP